MHDIRIERWAHALVHYCLSLKEGDNVSIHATSLATPLIEAVYREVLHAGANPIPFIGLEHLNEILLKEGSPSQIENSLQLMSAIAPHIDARLSILSTGNTKALSNINPAQSAHQTQASMKIRAQMHERWCLTLYPTSAYAQDAEMSLHDFEEFVFNVCFLNDADPIASWRAVGAEQQRLVDWLVGRKRVHILGPNTDLTLSIEDRIFINSDGKRNFPSGEFFTGPLENSAEGVIQFDVPSSYSGRTIEGVRLVFHEGKVVEASARQGQQYLESMLEMDAGARYLGEFAFGNNPGVVRATKNTLFDEKMGGTVHLALGNSYPETGGLNKSALHWDMVCDLRQQGEVWIDDVLFLKDGKHLV
ncbi:MAG: aminopeptidase [Ktedonobacteraceae bacterium]